VHQKSREHGSEKAGTEQRVVSGQWTVNSTDADLDRKFWAALAMYAVLAVLAWFTMGEGTVPVFGRPVDLRLLPLVVLGGLALRTVLARQAEKIRRAGKGSS
jgi:hypothetical protein